MSHYASSYEPESESLTKKKGRPVGAICRNATENVARSEELTMPNVAKFPGSDSQELPQLSLEVTSTSFTFTLETE